MDIILVLVLKFSEYHNKKVGKKRIARYTPYRNVWVDPLIRVAVRALFRNTYLSNFGPSYALEGTVEPN